MHVLCRPSTATLLQSSRTIALWVALLFACLWVTAAHCMTDDELGSLRQDARFMFYHGLTNYQQYAFPEDELRPLSCEPLTRDRANPAHIEVNDVLGNYTLSIVDSLSTLAILASTPTSDRDRHNALDDFQRYIKVIVELYGDGSDGPSGRGTRARGFDLDSKVQVFETTIRGVGGLLSAHLFAVGDLPIRGYQPHCEKHADNPCEIRWNISGKDFVYKGQLLHLARDLADRLLPAFHTPTGLPYPRVNLRHGIPFYENSPLNNDAEHGQCQTTQVPKAEREITETCSAGAGSLVLEFTTLSRLIGDDKYEKLAKRAFWAVWERRSGSGLIGAGIDAETGQWISPYTGIGAGIDSFFEYSLKSHILLSGLDGGIDLGNDDSPAAFLKVWQDAHSAISRHIYRGPHFQHPHYAQNDMWTGGPRLAWIDSLSAYYPGLLALAGELEEAATTHLLYTALWHRYGALPERWNTFNGRIDAGLRWWGGRPEFIESTWYLYHATKDPWYLHVGEMTMKDIKRRCYTSCGWAGLQDVRTGEQSDRMESFFLGETVKYLYLLFDPDHPLNKLDAPFVFTTEGHPLIIPQKIRRSVLFASGLVNINVTVNAPPLSAPQCPLPPAAKPFSVSNIAARADLFHAAALARLHQMPTPNTTGSQLLDHAIDHPSMNAADTQSPTNYTYYPWTLPKDLVPEQGYSVSMAIRQTFDLTFPSLPNSPMDIGALQRLEGGILVNSVSGLRFGLALDKDAAHASDRVYRIYALSNLALGRDESIWLGPNVVDQINPSDPHLSRMKDIETIDLIIDAPGPTNHAPPQDLSDRETLDLESTFADFFANPMLQTDLTNFEGGASSGEQILRALPKVLFADGERLAEHLESLADLSMPTINVDHAFRAAAKALRQGNARRQGTDDSTTPTTFTTPTVLRFTHPAMLPTGPGAAALPLTIDTGTDAATLPSGHLPYQSIYMLDDTLCSVRLPTAVVKKYSVLVIRRGQCSFSSKLENIPSFAPTKTSLQIVIIVSFPENEELSPDGGRYNIRPLLDKVQLTPSGVERRNPIAIVMTSGGNETWDVLKRAASTVAIVNSIGEIEEFSGGERKHDRSRAGTSEIGGGGIGIKRRLWFASQGIRIANLFAH